MAKGGSISKADDLSKKEFEEVIEYCQNQFPKLWAIMESIKNDGVHIKISSEMKGPGKAFGKDRMVISSRVLKEELPQFPEDRLIILLYHEFGHIKLNRETDKSQRIPAEHREFAEEKRVEMLEAVSMFNEQLMEDLLEENKISKETIHNAIKAGVLALELCPVYMGSAFKNKGVQPLLDAINRYLPSPLEAEPTEAIDLANGGSKVLLDTDPEKPTVAMAFKLTEEQFGQLTYARIYQGKLRKGEQLVNTRTGKKLRVGRMVRMHSNDRDNIDYAEAGDIVAMIGVDCASGDTFCNDDIRLACESIFVPDSVISLAIKAKDNEQQMKMSKAIGRFMREDPTFRVHSDEESGETIIAGMGELHLDIYIERMRREYGAEVIVGAPQVNYREAITIPAEYDHLHKKQTGGSGQFAGVTGMIEPLPRDSEESFVFENKIFGGSIPSEHIQACEKGV